MKVSFLIERKVEGIIEITPKEFAKLARMNNDDKHDFFWNKAVHYIVDTANVTYAKIEDLEVLQ